MQLYVQWVKQFGNIMCWRLGSTPMVVLSDPVDWVTLLSGKESPPLPKLTRMYQVIEVVSVRQPPPAAKQDPCLADPLPLG